MQSLSVVQSAVLNVHQLAVHLLKFAIAVLLAVLLLLHQLVLLLLPAIAADQTLVVAAKLLLLVLLLALLLQRLTQRPLAEAARVEARDETVQLGNTAII